MRVARSPAHAASSRAGVGAPIRGSPKSQPRLLSGLALPCLQPLPGQSAATTARYTLPGAAGPGNGSLSACSPGQGTGAPLRTSELLLQRLAETAALATGNSPLGGAPTMRSPRPGGKGTGGAAAAPADSAAPATARGGARENIYARMSQGLPSMETARSARGQSLLPQVHPQALAQQQQVPQQPAHPLAVRVPARGVGYAGSGGLGVDGPTASTSLTPRLGQLSTGGRYATTFVQQQEQQAAPAGARVRGQLYRPQQQQQQAQRSGLGSSNASGGAVQHQTAQPHAHLPQRLMYSKFSDLPNEAETYAFEADSSPGTAAKSLAQGQDSGGPGGSFTCFL